MRPILRRDTLSAPHGHTESRDPRAARRGARSRRRLRASLLAAALGLACGPTAEPEQRAPAVPGEPLPNIVLYVVDTLRADSLGVYGNPVVATPAIDAFARTAVVFPSARSTSSWTRASIASMLTGLYPDAHGAERRSDGLASVHAFLPELLEQRGYQTGAVISNPNVGSFYGFERGFGDFIELYAQPRGEIVDSEDMSADAADVAQRAIEWIDTAREPFFLLVLAIDPHDPYAAPPRFDRYGGGYEGSAEGSRWTLGRRNLSPEDRARVRSLYWAEVAYSDAAFGQVLGHLDARGVGDRTAVVFTSDHGEEFWEHGGVTHGQELFEESIRVPLIVRLPAAAEVAREPRRALDARGRSQGLDLFPTLLELAGVPAPAASQGISLFAPASERGSGSYASLRLDDREWRTVVEPPWKLLENTKTGRIALFDLDRDPRESRNVAAQFPEVVARLRRKLAAIAESSAELHVEAPQRRDLDLPARARKLLEELGYIGDAEPSVGN